MMLVWRRFNLHLGGGELILNGKPVYIEEKSCSTNENYETGYIVWDGSIFLSKAIEYSSLGYSDFKSKRVLEIGSGTGLAGLATQRKLSGSYSLVQITDIGICLPIIWKNIVKNMEVGEDKGSSVEVFELDWTKPIPKRVQNIDIVIASDIIWISSLVEPLVQTLTNIAKQNPNVDIFIAHQTRSKAVDDLFFEKMSNESFIFRSLRDTEKENNIKIFHPEFDDPNLDILKFKFVLQELNE